jgi:hypothetical protein
MNKIMIGAMALALVGVASTARAADEERAQNESQAYFFNAAYNQPQVQTQTRAQHHVRNAQASVTQQGVKPFTAAEAQWFEDATPETAN